MLKQRILTALVLAPIAIAGVLLLDTPMFALVLGAVFAFGLLEWSRLIGMRHVVLRVALVAVAVVLMALAWQYRAHRTLELAVACGAAWWLLASLWLRHF